VSIELAVTTPAFLDLTFVGLEALPGPGEERYAGDLIRSPGGGAITAVAGARLGLETALVAPLGTDLAGEFVRAEMEREGVAVAGFTPDRTPQTVVMPYAGDRAMVTIDPGTRARAADMAALEPVACAGNLEQLELFPDGARRFLTCGDDDARAFSGRLPAGLFADAIFASGKDALVLTKTETYEDAAAKLAEAIDVVGLVLTAPDLLLVAGGRRIEVPDFDAGAIIDPTGDRDLLCAAYAWARLRGADLETGVAWAQLYSRLAMTVPTATRGALTEEQLLQEGTARGLTPPR
jgi:sugar/nucleoside kinase (ribokinase family)